MSKLFLGCIADDVTGATDLASNLVQSGMRVVQTIGIPSVPLEENADAVVIALKTRTMPVAEAVELSRQALAWLREQGAQQIYFKYCSTFDSTPTGNIGPVTEALMEALDTDFTIACPAFPENGRTIYKGYLYVGDELLHESGMRNHPLTPMHDSNLVRVLQAQSRRRVGLIEVATVMRGTEAVARRIQDLQVSGIGMAVVDALCNADLLCIGSALAGMPLVTGASGLATGLPQNFGIQPSYQAAKLPAAYGRKAIISGSCSTATNNQVRHYLENGGLAYVVDPLALEQGQPVVERALAWAANQKPDQPVLVYATAEPETVTTIQSTLGVARAGQMIEEALSAIARGLVQQGISQLVVAGGETSGACVKMLGIRSMRIGPAIAPGVPWCHAHSVHARGGALHIALKSGNFGGLNFFTEAFSRLD